MASFPSRAPQAGLMRRKTNIYLSIWLLIAFLLGLQANAQLSSSFYSGSCDNLTSIVQNAIQQAVNTENRMAASIIRLHFHDCFVNGCDGSLLLNGGERTAPQNDRSVRGFNVIDDVKSAVESVCPGVVSCADILALSARESVRALGGPSWTVVFGRRDSTSSGSDTSSLPPPSDTASQLVTNFENQELSRQDLVALSGAHTIGQARCTNFRNRLYNGGVSGDTIDSSFRSQLQGNCPSSGGDDNLSPLDQSPVQFDNRYFLDLQNQQGLLFSDQQLFSGGDSSLSSLVNTYASDQQTFFDDFAAAMVKMGNINPLTGSAGEIRANCQRAN